MTADLLERSASTGHVVVSVPYFRCREHVRQCVESVLGQTHADLTVVVVNDGDPEPPWDLLEDLDDPRLVGFDLARNRGRYFADQVVLGATRAPFFLVHDADNWSDPRRVEVLLRELRRAHAGVAVSGTLREDAASGAVRVLGVDGLRRPLGERFEHRVNFTGLYRTDALRAVGGFYAGLRVGYDSFVLNAVAMTAPVATCDEPLYHWRCRPDSLTTAPATRAGSPQRRRARRVMQAMHAEAYAAYLEYLDGALDAEGLASRIRALGAARVGRAARIALTEETKRLGAALAAGPPRPPAPARAPRRLAMDDVLGARRPPPGPASSLLFWSSFDLHAWRRDRHSPAWIEYRFRHWLAYTLPSILAQREGEFRYWLVCDPAGRALTEPLRAAIRDDRVRLVYADECPALLRRHPHAGRHLVTRIDSDDMYHPDVAGDLLARRATAAFLQFNRGYACDLRSGRLCDWRARSSPFYCHVYGDELHERDAWREPGHTTVRAHADLMRSGRFLVTIHHANTSSSLPLGAASLPERRRRQVLEAFGLGGPRRLDALLACARAPGDWVRRRRGIDGPGVFALLREATAARRVLVTGSPGGAREGYDLALTDAAGAPDALRRLLPSGLALIHDTPERLDAVLGGCCADTYPELRELTHDEHGRESVLVGRVVP